MEKDDFIQLNCLGDICPVPIMKLIKYEKKLADGEKIMLVTDHSCTAESVRNYCHDQKLGLEIVEPINGVWEMYISERKVAPYRMKRLKKISRRFPLPRLKNIL